MYFPYANLTLGIVDASAMATTAGAGSLIIGVLLVVLGLTMWFQPQSRVFAGVAAILLALVSLRSSQLRRLPDRLPAGADRRCARRLLGAGQAARKHESGDGPRRSRAGVRPGGRRGEPGTGRRGTARDDLQLRNDSVTERCPDQREREAHVPGDEVHEDGTSARRRTIAVGEPGRGTRPPGSRC